MIESEKMDFWKYRLFALPVNDETIAATDNERFCRVTPFYVLVYTDAADGCMPNLAVEIVGEDIERLSAADRDWLLSCVIVMLNEDAQKREAEIAESLGERIERLEIELEKAARKVKGGD